MAWNFRKAINLGYGARINLSNHGIGYSIGTRGARIGVDSRGRAYKALSIPNTGLYNRSAISRHEGCFSLMLVVLALIMAFVGAGRHRRKHKDWS